MGSFCIQLLFKRVKNDSDRNRNQTKSYESYIEEQNRLGALKDDSENIWEERTYQLSAGGLSLTFAVFSFLMSGKNKIPFQWQMAAIWGGYIFCLVLNYISNRISIYKFKKLQKQLYEDRVNGIEYNEERLIKRNSDSDLLMNIINIITEVILITDIILTIVYTCVLF